MYISQKQLLKSSTRSERWLSKLDLKKEISKYHVKDHAPVRKLRPTIPTTCHKSNNWWNCFSFTSVGLPLYIKFPLGDRRLFPLFGWTYKRKPVAPLGIPTQRIFWENRTWLVTWCSYKQLFTWNWKIFRLWLALKLPYISIIIKNSEKSVQTQALIYLRS